MHFQEVSQNGLMPVSYTHLDVYKRQDKARTRKNNGIGLGLSICSEICNMYNISLDIKSKLNVGTEVILIFNKEHFLHES